MEPEAWLKQARVVGCKRGVLTRGNKKKAFENCFEIKKTWFLHWLALNLALNHWIDSLS